MEETTLSCAVRTQGGLADHTMTVTVGQGPGGISLVGFGSDARDILLRARVRTAMRACGFEVPPKVQARVEPPLSPGEHTDSLGLPLAAGVIAATGQAPPSELEREVWSGELEPNGDALHALPERVNGLYDLRPGGPLHARGGASLSSAVRAQSATREGVDWDDVRRRAFALADLEVSRDPDSLEARGARDYLRTYFEGIFSDVFLPSLLDAVSEANPGLSGGDLDAALAEVAGRQARSHFRADLDLGADRFAEISCEFCDIDLSVGNLPQAAEHQRRALSDALKGRPVARMRTPEGDLVVREAGDGEGYRGFAVDLEGPDGSGGRVSWTEVVAGSARDGYPTPVHTFAWDGRDEDAARVDCDPEGPFMREEIPTPSAQETFECSLAAASSTPGAARTRAMRP